MTIHSKFVVLCLVIITILVSSCETKNGSPTAAELGQIKGSVVTLQGAPVAGALVTTTPATREVRTDSEGSFLIPVVASGDYLITARFADLQGNQQITVETLKNTLVTITLEKADNGGGDGGGGDGGGGDGGGGDGGGGDGGGGDPGTGLPPGLIAYFPLDGNAADVTNHFPSGKMNGVVKTENRHGKPGMAMQFDGMNSVIEVPMDPERSLQRFPMTWSYWLRPSPDQGTRNGTMQAPIGIYLHPLGDGVVFLWENDVFATVYSTLGFVNWTRVDGRLPRNGQWHHVAMTVSYDGMTVFVDGALAGQTKWYGRPTMSTSQEPLRMGAIKSVHPTDPTRPYSGAMDDVMMFNRVLTTQEIQLLLRQ